MKQKNFKMSDGACQILAGVSSATGQSGARIVELAVTLYAIGIGKEVQRARQFLTHNLNSMVANVKTHEPKNGPPRKSKQPLKKTSLKN